MWMAQGRTLLGLIQVTKMSTDWGHLFILMNEVKYLYSHKNSLLSSHPPHFFMICFVIDGLMVRISS